VPLCEFLFTATDQYGRVSALSTVSIFNTYADSAPVVNDIVMVLKKNYDNVWEPVEVPTNGPYPTQFLLTSLPATTEVYQATNGLRVGDQIVDADLPAVINDKLILYSDNDFNESFKYTVFLSFVSSPLKLSLML
jgi:hypothetical protein